MNKDNKKELMLRFLHSLKLEDYLNDFSDLEFVSIQKASREKNEKPKFLYHIRKKNPWKYRTLDLFLRNIEENINYEYEIYFTYDKEFNDVEIKEFIDEFIFNKSFDEYNYSLYKKNGIYLYYKDEEEHQAFLLIKKDLEDLFSFINFDYPIKDFEVHSLTDEEMLFYQDLIRIKTKKEEAKNIDDTIKIVDQKEEVTINEETIIEEEKTPEFDLNSMENEDEEFISFDSSNELINEEEIPPQDSDYEKKEYYEEEHYYEGINEDIESIHNEEEVDINQIKKEYDEKFLALKEETESYVLYEAKNNYLRDKKREEYYELLKKPKEYVKLNVFEINANSLPMEFEGRAFNYSLKRTDEKGNFYIRFGVTDNKGAVVVEYRASREEMNDDKFSKITETEESKEQVFLYVRVKGKVKEIRNGKDITIFAHKVEVLGEDPLLEEKYQGEERRVELHLHTNFSDLDGINKIQDYVKNAKNLGMKAIAVTDHGVVQSFPDAQNAGKKYGVKILYGSELYMINDYLNAAFNPKDIKLSNASFVAFDLETTGLSIRLDRITEIGAVKVVGGMVVDTFDTFVNPKIPIPKKIEEKTHISNEMVKNAPGIDEVLPKFLEFIKGSILIAHNADFDYEMINEPYRKIYGEDLDVPVIDTLALSRYIFPEKTRHSLGALCKNFDVDYDEDEAHRADYDANVLASCWIGLQGLLSRKFNGLSHKDLEKLEIPQELYKNLRGNHVTVLCKDREGLKDLYKIISASHTDYIGKVPLTPRSLIEKYREHLLVGSACFNGEVFYSTTNRNDEKLDEAISFYDYIEIQPLKNYSYLINTEEILNIDVLKSYLKTIIEHAEKMNKPVVATGDTHYLYKSMKLYRDVFIATEGIGKTRHPLNPYYRKKYGYFDNPDQEFMTTQDMLDAFAWLEDEEKIHEYVIKNTNLIADMCESITPIDDKLYTPTIDNVEGKLKDIVYERAYREYGNPLPEIIANRLNAELKGIIDNGFAVIYYIAHLLVKKTNERGYIVGSRGSVGSSFVAYCAGITEVNALAPHYRCPKCKHFEWHDTRDGVTSGYDLPDKVCPECGTMMVKDGQTIPFETFLGFSAEKTPDIDLNFPADFKDVAHNFTKELWGDDNVFRAGTIANAEFKTCKKYVRDYFDFMNIDNNAVSWNLVEGIASGCVGVKRTTGQHPGGIIVIPTEYSVYDFTPIQYPANEKDSSWKTTHFAYKALHETVLKLDMLGHVDPQALKMMSDLTGVKVEDINVGDREALSIFQNNKALKMKHKYIKIDDVATTGIPEFGTNFVKQIVREVKPKSFSDLVIISGLSHGTNVWSGNAQDLVKNGFTNLRGVIGCRDDIMTYLISMGIDKSLSFKIMEKVRKGKSLSDEEVAEMKRHNVPDYYISSCDKIKYLFPKGHACAYVIMALRVAYFKVYYPLEYYATFFTLRCDQYDIETMCKGLDAIWEKLEYYRKRKDSKNPEDKLSTKEIDINDTLIAALEFAERGYKFEMVDIYRSDPDKFIVDHDKKSLIPPFRVIDGLGLSVGNEIVKARNESPFYSIEDFQKRGKVSQTLVDVMKNLGALKYLRETETLDLFTDFM